jgi:hypothetical protein
MFSFVDTPPNTYSSVNQYQQNLPFLFSSFNDIIKSEDSVSCDITSEDRYDYNIKLQELQNIINRCNNASNKHECLYNNFTDDRVVNLINELTNIVKKISKECMYNRITPEQEENMCSNSNNILNNYNTNDLNKVSVFFAKYSNIIKNLKNIADTNIFDYLNKCGTNTQKLESYNRAQNVLAYTLFQLGGLNTSIHNNLVQTNVDTRIDTRVDNTTLNTTQNNFNSCINDPEISERFIDLNNQIRTLTTDNAILNDKVYKLSDDKLKCDRRDLSRFNNKKNDDNRWIYIVFMSVFIIIIIVLIYVIVRRRNPTIIPPYDPMSTYVPPPIN